MRKKVSVIGSGFVGATVGHILVAKELADVVMVDIESLQNKTQGKALDLAESTPVDGADVRVIGTSNYDATADSDVVVITAGIPRKPGMSRMDLLEVNAGIVSEVTKNILKHSDNPIIVVVTNPLDQMTTLTAEVSNLSKNRVIGQAGVLDSSRFAYFISEKVGVDISSVEALTLGSHGETMVPVPSLCKVDGKPLEELLSSEEINDLVQKTSDGGAEIVSLLKTGSAYFAPASSAATMVKAMLSDSNEIFPVCAWLNGEYGINDVYLGVPARLGADGITEIVEYDLTDLSLIHI